MGFNAYMPFAAQSFLESIFPSNEIVAFTAFYQVVTFLGFMANYLSINGLWVINIIIFPVAIYLIFFYKTNIGRYKYEKMIEN